MDDEAASRVAALLSHLQSLEYAIESCASYVVDERTTWTIVTLIEAWKVTLRLRLLGRVQPGRLTSSFSREPPREEWSQVVGKLSASLLKQRGGSALQQRPSADEVDRIAARLMRAGEIMHILQPLAYLALIHWVGRRAPCSAFSSLPAVLRRRLPWLTALALESGGLMLCTLGAHRLEQQQQQQQQRNGGSSQRRVCSVAAKENAAELRHRRALLLLFVARPSACAAARILVGHASRGGHTQTQSSGSGGGGGSLIGFCASQVVELLDALDRSCWARYFRTSEVHAVR